MKHTFVAALCLVAAVSATNCKQKIRDVEFDLGPLQRPFTQPLVVQDRERETEGRLDYTYYFNFCRNVEPPAKHCNVTKGSSDRHKDQPEPTKTGPAAAFQVAGGAEGTPTDCHRVGSGMVADRSWELYDSNDPAKGVKLKYRNGDKCGEYTKAEAERHNFYHTKQVQEGDDRYRELTINLICDSDLYMGAEENGVADQNPIWEDTKCSYQLDIKTIYGCPTGCSTAGRSLCGGERGSPNGVCGYDEEQHKARCFCFPGQFGNDCNETSVWEAGHTAVIIVFAMLTIALLIAVIVFTILVWKRVQGLRLDPEAYSSMGADNIATMQMTKTADMDELTDNDDDDEEV